MRKFCLILFLLSAICTGHIFMADLKEKNFITAIFGLFLTIVNLFNFIDLLDVKKHEN